MSDFTVTPEAIKLIRDHFAQMQKPVPSFYVEPSWSEPLALGACRPTGNKGEFEVHGGKIHTGEEFEVDGIKFFIRTDLFNRAKPITVEVTMVPKINVKNNLKPNSGCDSCSSSCSKS